MSAPLPFDKVKDRLLEAQRVLNPRLQHPINHSRALLLLSRPVASVVLCVEECIVLDFFGQYWVLEVGGARTGFFNSGEDALRYLQGQRSVAEGRRAGEMNGESERLIITGSFNGLLDRVAKMDHFGVWLTGRKLLKMAKRDRIEATMSMTEVLKLTGLTREDVEFFVSLRLIERVEGGEDARLSFKEVFCLVKIFERFVDEEIIV